MSDTKSKKYIHNYKQSKRSQLQYGMKGFLCSFNFSEHKCIQDIHNIFTEFDYFSPNDLSGENIVATVTATAFADHDLQNEIRMLKKKQQSVFEILKIGMFFYLNKIIFNICKKCKVIFDVETFFLIELGMKNMLFISLKRDSLDPKVIQNQIIERIVNERQQISKNILKMLPIENVVKADLNTIRETVSGYFLKNSIENQPKLTFAVICNIRFNNVLNKEEIISVVADEFVKSGHRSSTTAVIAVDLTNPDFCVIVEILMNFCMFSVVRDFYKYNKFNLNQLIAKHCLES